MSHHRTNFYQRHSVGIMAILVFLLPMVVVGAIKAKSNNRNDVKGWLPAEYPETRTYRFFRQNFQGEEFILVSWEGCTMADARLEMLARKLLPPPEEASRIERPLYFKAAQTGPRAVERMCREPLSLDREEAIARLTGALIGPPPAGVEAGSAADDLDARKTCLVSWFSLKNTALVAMVIASGVYSMFASLAVVWYSGYPVDAILLTMPSLVYVATTSGAIHLANYYRDQLAETGVQEGSAGRAVHHALLPLSLATGTTAIGLATLAVSELVPIRMFGIFSAAGVVVSFVILVTFMPAALELFPPKLRVGKLAGEEEAVGWKPIEESRWWGVGEWITRHHALATAACLFLMAAVGYGMTRVESSVQLMRLFSRNAQIRTDYAWLESHLGPLVPMELLVRIDESCPLTFLERMELVDEIQREIGQLQEVGSSLSAVTFGRSLDTGAGDGLRARLARSTLNKALLRHRDDFLAGDYLRDATVTAADGSQDRQELWRISARVSAIQEVDYALFKADLQRKIDPILARIGDEGVPGVAVDYTGLVPLVYKAQHSLLENLKIGFIFDFAIIVVVMIVLCRAVSAGLVLLLPAAFPAILVFGGMGWGNALFKWFQTGNLFIDIGTVMAPSVALGVTVDDVVHFMLWFRRGIADGLDRKQATMLAYKGCARAMYQSWGVIGIGLSVLSLSPFGPTQRFGYMMLSMLTIALVGNLVLMPALLSGPLGAVFSWSVLRIERNKARRNGRTTVKEDPGSDALPPPHVLPGQSKQVVHA